MQCVEFAGTWGKGPSLLGRPGRHRQSRVTAALAVLYWPRTSLATRKNIDLSTSPAAIGCAGDETSGMRLKARQ